MKKVFKKALIVLLIIVTILNFIGFEHVSYATEDTVSQILVGLLGSFVGILSWPIRIFAMAAGKAVEMLTSNVAYMDGATAGNSGSVFSITPYEILFNKVQLLDINFFDFSVAEDSATYKVRTAVAGWFYVMRLLAVSILLLILIYMGIRMAITTIAEEKARYKKMLVDWVTSIALVFFLQFIIMFTVMANTALVNALDSSSLGDEISAAIGDIATKALFFSIESFACTVVYCMLVFQTLGLVISYINRMIKIAFLIIISPLISITYSIDKIGDGKSQALDTWLKEFVYTVLMQPFHCIIYMVFINTAFELLIADGNPGWEHNVASAVVAILCVKFTKDAEKIVRKIFNFKDENNGTSLAAGTGAALLALNHAKSLGSSARKGINFMKENNLVKAVGKDLSAVGRGAKAAAIATFGMKDEKKEGRTFSERVHEASGKDYSEKAKEKRYTAKKNKKIDKLVNRKGKDEKEAIKEVEEKLKKKETRKENAKKVGRAVTAPIRGVSKGAGKVVKGARGVARVLGKSETLKFVKNSIIPAGLGFAAGSMAYGGDSNLFTSATLGAAVNNSMGEFMKNSTGTLANTVAENLVAAGANQENAADTVANASAMKASGEFDNKKFDQIIQEIHDLLGKANINKGASDIRKQIESAMQNVTPNVNIDSMLKRALGEDYDKLEKSGQMESVKQKATSYKQKRAMSNIANTLETAGGLNVSVDTMAKVSSRKFEGAYETVQKEGEYEGGPVGVISELKQINSAESSEVKQTEAPTLEQEEIRQEDAGEHYSKESEKAIEELMGKIENGQIEQIEDLKREIENISFEKNDIQKMIKDLSKKASELEKSNSSSDSQITNTIKRFKDTIDILKDKEKTND